LAPVVVVALAVFRPVAHDGGPVEPSHAGLKRSERGFLANRDGLADELLKNWKTWIVVVGKESE
jgi:hypothetical protein